MKVILTGSTGMVGEGVLLECLDHPDVTQVLMVNRKSNPVKHPKLEELIVPDFLTLEEFTEQLTGYDACFYCAGISSSGMSEQQYSHITYDTTIHFGRKLASLNPAMVFNHVSGSHTNSSEQGKIMWARVKGKTENALMKLPFRKVYNFRPGIMKPTAGQKNIRSYYKIIDRLFPVLRFLFPKYVLTLREVGLAMINSVLNGYPIQILEIKDIKSMAQA